MAALDPVEFVARHGVVLASGKGRVPNLAEAIAGEPIRGGWWGHPKGRDIFRALGALDDSPDVICLRLVERKITYVHRRLWPALVRLAAEFGKERLTAIRQEHTKTGSAPERPDPVSKLGAGGDQGSRGEALGSRRQGAARPWASGR